MMDSLKIATGEIRLAINDDPNRIIAFNPRDVVFAEKFYRVFGEFQAKAIEYKARHMELSQNSSLDINGLPVNMDAQIALLHETCEFTRTQIDYVFGVGTSQIVFGDAMVLEQFEQFFEGVTPYVQTVRVEKIAKYVPHANGNGRKKSRKRAK